jgi:hypothetical protein
MPSGGVLVIRSCFSEALQAPYHPFFAGLLERERDLLPTTSTVVDALQGARLRHVTISWLRQRLDDDYRAYAEPIRTLAMSAVRMMPDEEFDAGNGGPGRVRCDGGASSRSYLCGRRAKGTTRWTVGWSPSYLRAARSVLEGL